MNLSYSLIYRLDICVLVLLKKLKNLKIEKSNIKLS